MANIEIFGYEPHTSQKLPLFLMSVSAGFPIPVEHEIEKEIDLNEFLVEHPAATFFARVKGFSLETIGINDSDVLICDTAIEPTDGKLVLVLVNNELTVKFYRCIDGEVFLQSQNLSFMPLKIEPYIEFSVVGVVTKVIHSL